MLRFRFVISTTTLVKLVVGEAADGLVGARRSRAAADSREVKPHYLFAALTGTKTDGGGFIEEARHAARWRSWVPRRPRTLGRGGSAASSRIRSSPPACADRGGVLRRSRVAVAVAGTKGNTSVAPFLRQLWASQAPRPEPRYARRGRSPLVTKFRLAYDAGPGRLHAHPCGIDEEGVTDLALEASSDGLTSFVSRHRASPAAPSPISRAIIPGLSRDLRGRPRQTCAFSTLLLPLGGADVVDGDSEFRKA